MHGYLHFTFAAVFRLISIQVDDSEKSRHAYVFEVFKRFKERANLLTKVRKAYVTAIMMKQ